MNLKNDKRQNTQGELGSCSTGRGEAPETGAGEIESFLAANEDESPGNTDRIMEEICEWENLKEAMGQVKANKGSAGIDGMTVDELPDYRDLLVIRDQLLSGTYKPQPVKRVEIPKADGGVRKLGIPTALGSVCPASGDASSATAVGPDVLRQQLWFPAGTVCASSSGASAATYRCRLRLGG